MNLVDARNIMDITPQQIEEAKKVVNHNNEGGLISKKLITKTTEATDKILFGDYTKNPELMAIRDKNTSTFEYLSYRDGRTVVCTIFVDGYLVGKGIAKCHPTDEFDLDLGYYIAQKRAEIDYLNYSIKNYTELKEMGMNRVSWGGINNNE